MTLNDHAMQPEPEASVLDMVKQVVGLGTNDTKPADPRTVAASIHKFEHVHIIVNPSSGQNGPDLSILNKVLQDLNITWEMFVTRFGGDARERTKAANRHRRGGGCYRGLWG
jgi:hypothetical protein